ncbi:hypothetical protein [Chryseobacterium gossypii]|uniref:hypothetical protein n=1 Tax=Chryseobacterium gossypii TaxID=3231602 RepID=UPI0035240D9F
MRKKNLLTLLGIAISLFSWAQTGNVGIDTPVPGSKLTVNGSFAGAYNFITTNIYSVGENDFSMMWNGTAAGTIVLPASTSGPDRTGRLYFIKNSSSIYTLTIDAAGTEVINNSQTLVLEPSESALLVKTDNNTSSGITYDVIQVSKTQTRYEYAVSSDVTQTRNAGIVVPADFSTIEYSTNGGGDFNLATDTWTCPQAGYYRVELTETGYIVTSDAMTHVLMRILKNGVSVSNGFYNLGNSATTTNLRNSGYTSRILYIAQGETISASLQSCSSCVPQNISTDRRMVITRL